MPHETLKVRLLEFMGTELDNLYVEKEYVERNYVERKEFFLITVYRTSAHVDDNFHNYSAPTYLL